MRIAFAGAVDGCIMALYEKITEPVDWIVCTGNLGVWPDIARVDRATKQRARQGDFATLYLEGWQAPIQTLFVSGVHEDHKWLYQRVQSGQLEILPNVHLLANGYRTTIGDMTNVCRVTGLGKVYSKSTYEGKFNKKSPRHYTRNEVTKACSSGPTDLLLMHENPDTGDGLKNLIYATRPKLVAYSAVNSKVSKCVSVPTLGLAKEEVIFLDYKNNAFSSIDQP